MGINNRVVIIAADYPVDYDKYFRNRLDNLMKRAVRHKDRFPSLDLPELQARVNRNVAGLQTKLNGRYAGLLDVMNYVRCGRSMPRITPENAHQHLTHAGMISLNGIYLYQYLSDNGFEPHIIQNFSLSDLEKELSPTPLAVCISTNFIYLDEMAEMAGKIKAVDPDIPVIAGGLLVKKVLNAGNGITPQTMAWLKGFNNRVDQFIVEFRGEESLVRSLRTIQAEGDLFRVPNLALYDREGDIRFTGREIEPLDMDQSCINWQAVPDRYLRKTVPVTSSRGCSFRCKFCTCWKLCPQVHYKSIDALKTELIRIQEKGYIRHVRFTDDNFTANRHRLQKILEMMIDQGFTFTWSTYARAGSMSPGIVRLMRKAGCEFVNMGIESGSQTILDNMDKRLDRNQVIDAVRLLNANGIYGEGGFILGFPGETEATFADTMDLLNQSRLPYFQPNLFYFSKEMAVAGEQEQFGLEGLALTWRHNTMDSARASELMTEMVENAKHGFHEPQVSAWETFRLLRGEGYSPGEIFKLFALKRDLRVARREGNGKADEPDRVGPLLDRFKEVMARVENKESYQGELKRAH